MNLTSENLPQSWVNSEGSPSATAIINEEYGGESGQIVPDATAVTVTTTNENIFQQGLNWAVNGVKAIWRAIKGFFNIGNLIRWGVGAVQRIWNFNWNITDATIKQQQKSNIEGLAETWGEALGSFAGTALCGFSLGRAALASRPNNVNFDPEMMAKIDELRINNFDDDSALWEEARENFISALASTARAVGNNLAMEGFLNVRKLIKVAAKGISLSSIAPGLAANIENWGKEGQEPWSFASNQEVFTENLQDGWHQNFGEGFIEAFQEMCGESLIQVSHLYG